jgi:DNA-binding beta-propeller fold protein YncE
MSMNNSLKNKFFVATGIGLFLCALAAAGAATKLKVIDSGGGRVFKEPRPGQVIATLPMNTFVDGQAKKGEFWMITFDRAGVKATGYIHEVQVAEVKEGEAAGTAAGAGPVKTQDQLAAEIQVMLTQNKELIPQSKDLAKAADSLKALIAKTFRLENPQQQKQAACEIYFWIGQALSRQGDELAAIKEYRNMYEVDESAANKITEYVPDLNTIKLIEIAERQYKGVFDGYTLHVETDPKEAIIKIDGEVKGRSPAIYTSIQVPRVTLEIEKEGYRPIKEIVSLIDAAKIWNYTLESLGRTVRVISNIPGARVFLDGRDTGKVTDCEIPLVPYGPHSLKVKKEYYADWDETFTVSEGSDPLAKSALLTVKDYAQARSWGGPDKKLYITPKALALDTGGNFYVADESGVTLRKFNPEGLLQKSWGSDGQQFKRLKVPSGIAFDSKGNFYVTDARSHNVAKFDKNGQQVKTWGKLGAKEGELSGPLGVAIDRNGDVLVVDAGNSRVVKYSSEGVLKKTWGKAGLGQGQFTLPTGVAVSKNNDIIVVDQGRIQKFTTDGAFIDSFGKLDSAEAPINRPFGVCLDGDDYIYVADTGNNRILKFAPDGKFICQFGASGSGAGQLTTPVAVAVNDKGWVFVLERSNARIQIFRMPSN